MKLFIVLAAIACCNAAKLDKTYLPPSHSQSSGGSNFLQVPFAGSANSLSGQNNGPSNINPFAPNRNVQNSNSFGNFENRPERAQAAFERNAAILRQDNQNDGETYAYAYETENGINAEENGVATNGVEAQGGYSYTGDDGQVYSVRYTAGQNGFVPQGDHLPTPPPIPEEILKALEQNARDEAAGIYDDGSYNAGKYNEDQSNVNAFNQFNNGNAYQNNNDDDSVITDNALFRNPSANFNSGNSNQRGFNGAPSQGVNKAYLPPFVDQRTTGAAFGNRRQPSFSPKSGYRY